MSLGPGQAAEFVHALDAIDSGHDAETGHEDADLVLLDVLQIVEPDVYAAYLRFIDRTGFWATA